MGRGHYALRPWARSKAGGDVSRKAIWRRVILLFAASFVVSVIAHMIQGYAVLSPVGLGGAFGGALTNFLLPGVIPLIVWAVRRFRAEAAKGPFDLWVILCVIFWFYALWGSVITARGS